MGARVSVVPLSSAPVDWLLWQRPPHAPVLTVACRVTFALQPGEATLAREQEPLCTAERPYPDGASRGVYTPRDLVPMKPRADVLLVGQAFAPRRQPVRSLVARLVVGELEKRVEVFGDRHFDQQGALHEGQLFTAMPLVYERAAGGPETQNPLGIRPDVRDRYGRLPLPNLQPTGLAIASPTQSVPPVGLGPIACSWPTRRVLLGPTMGAQGGPGEWQGPLVPADLDPSHFLAAPRDQQVQAIREDERIALENLSAEHPELVTRLPGARPRAFVEGRGAAPVPLTMRADTLWIETTRQICTVTWRGQLALDSPASALRVLVALEWPDRPLGWEDVARLESSTRAEPPPAREKPGTEGTQTLMAFGFQPGATLPFAPPLTEARPPRDHGLGGGLPFRRPGEAPPAPLPAPPQPREETVDELLSTLPVIPTSPTPASTPPPRMVPPAPPATAHPPAAGGTVDVAQILARAPSLPFSPTSPPDPVPMGDTLGQPIGGDTPVPPAPAPPAESVWARGGSPGIAPLDLPRPLVQPVQPVQPVAEPPPVFRPQPAPVPVRGGSPLHLAWFAPAFVPPLRRDERFAPVLDGLDERPLDDDLDNPDRADDVADVDERREVFEILARGEAVGEEGVMAALAGAVRGDGRYVQPIVLAAGELVFAFDEVETLKAMLSAAAPYAGVDPDARAVLALAKDLLAAPGQPPAQAVAEGVSTRIRETFEKRSLVAAGFLDGQVGRALLSRRHHQRRRLLGAPHVRALWSPGAGPTIPLYLDPETVANLPAAERLRARMLALVYPALDQNETHPAALRAVALAVVTPPLGRR